MIRTLLRGEQEVSNEIKELANYICSFRLEELPQPVLNAVKGCVLDNLGAALGAAKTKELLLIRSVYDSTVGSGGGYASYVWGDGTPENVSVALLINGMMAHELELDDVHTASKSHIGAVVVPTAWTLADALGSSGPEFLEAVTVGYEVMSRVGMGMDVASNRKRGWHATGIVGTFGSAAAAAKILKLDPEQTANALGLAGTQSSGLWAFLTEGASCKKLHTGRAAVNGFDSCLLARGGMTGAKHILDAPDGGLYQAVSDSFQIDRVCAELGTRYEVLAVDKKPYPCCRTTHSGIDGALSLRKSGLRAENIDHVTVETYEIGVLQCGAEKYPETAVEAKFSIRYTCAAAFVKGRVTQSEFSGEALHNSEIMRIARATDVVSSQKYSERYPQRWGCQVSVVCKDGTKLVCSVDDMSGSASVPLSPEQEHSKFTGLAEPLFGAEKAEALYQEITGLERLPRLPKLY